MGAVLRGSPLVAALEVLLLLAIAGEMPVLCAEA